MTVKDQFMADFKCVAVAEAFEALAAADSFEAMEKAFSAADGAFTDRISEGAENES